MLAVILFHVPANPFLFNNTKLPYLVCVGVIQAFCLSAKRKVLEIVWLMGKPGMKISLCVRWPHICMCLIQEYMEACKIALKVRLFS